MGRSGGVDEGGFGFAERALMVISTLEIDARDVMRSTLQKMGVLLAVEDDGSEWIDLESFTRVMLPAGVKLELETDDAAAQG